MSTMKGKAATDSDRMRETTPPIKVLIILTSVITLSISDLEAVKVGHPPELSTGWSLPTCAIPYSVFKSHGYQIVLASTYGDTADIDPSTLHFYSDVYCREALADTEFRSGMANTVRLSSDVNGAEFNIVLFAGGVGAMIDFVSSPFVDKVGRECYEKGGIIASIGHGSIALSNIRLSNGTFLCTDRYVTGATNEEDTNKKLLDYLPKHMNGLKSNEDLLKYLGCRFTKENVFFPHVELSDRVVTGQNDMSAFQVSERIIGILGES